MTEAYSGFVIVLNVGIAVTVGLIALSVLYRSRDFLRSAFEAVRRGYQQWRAGQPITKSQTSDGGLHSMLLKDADASL
jgi:hypothetical protein